MYRHPFACGLLAIVFAGAAVAAEGSDPAAAASKATNTTVREIGSALYFWAVDVSGERDPAAAAEHYEAPEAAAVRWSDCPALGYEEAQRLLVPRYLAELPRTDGWGYPLQLCMDPEGVRAHGYLVLGVRSPGADGRFDGDVYTVAPFDRSQLEHDVVWLDGYFVRWPQAK